MPKKPVTKRERKPLKPTSKPKKDGKIFPSANTAYNELKNHRKRTEAIAAELDGKPKKKK